MCTVLKFLQIICFSIFLYTQSHRWWLCNAPNNTHKNEFVQSIFSLYILVPAMMPSICSRAAANISLASHIMITFFETCKWDIEKVSKNMTLQMALVVQKFYIYMLFIYLMFSLLPGTNERRFCLTTQNRRACVWDNGTILPGLFCNVRWNAWNSRPSKQCPTGFMTSMLVPLAYSSREASLLHPRGWIPE